MPKLSSFVSLGTAGKVAGGIVAGGLSTVAVQRYTDSSEFSNDPQRAEMREEQKSVLCVFFKLLNVEFSYLLW